MEIKEELVWDESDDYIRHRVADPDKFDPDSMRTITLDEEKGIKAVVGCPKGNFEGNRCKVGMEQQNVMFEKAKGWTMEKAKAWWKSQQEKQTMSESLSENEREELEKLRKLKEIVEKTPETKVLSELVMQRNKEIEDNKAKIADLEKTKTALEAEKAKIPSLEKSVIDLEKSLKETVDLVQKEKDEKQKEILDAIKAAKEESAKKIEEAIPPKHILEGWNSLGAKRLVQDIKKKTKEIRE